MNQDSRLKFFSFITILFLVTMCFNSQVMRLGTLPLYHKVMVGEPLDLGFTTTNKLFTALKVDIETKEAKLMAEGNRFSLTESSPVVSSPGKVEMNLKLFGLIPLRQVTVDVVPPVEVMPGGQSIGVLLHTQGVMVVGMSTVVDNSGLRHNPADKAGIKTGDIVLKINGITIDSESQVRNIINQSGLNSKPLHLEILRDNKKIKTQASPIYCNETKSYRLGLFVRDGAAGVGTLTYYDPETSVYGALGHVITDSETGKKIDLSNGRITGAAIQEIHPGRRGQPGEKVGILQSNSNIYGSICKNTPYGIFGELSRDISNPFFKKPIPVALSHQIKEGPAEIITVINGNKMEKFEINIERVLSQAHPEGKGMIIKITDPRLLKITGGIIQGMSGSPIIQYKENGEPILIGAVTHVFINDPTSGYGVLAEWMLYESNEISNNNQLSTNATDPLWDNCA